MSCGPHRGAGLAGEGGGLAGRSGWGRSSGELWGSGGMFADEQINLEASHIHPKWVSKKFRCVPEGLSRARGASGDGVGWGANGESGSLGGGVEAGEEDENRCVGAADDSGFVKDLLERAGLFEEGAPERWQSGTLDAFWPPRSGLSISHAPTPPHPPAPFPPSPPVSPLSPSATLSCLSVGGFLNTGRLVSQGRGRCTSSTPSSRRALVPEVRWFLRSAGSCATSAGGITVHGYGSVGLTDCRGILRVYPFGACRVRYVTGLYFSRQGRGLDRKAASCTSAGSWYTLVAGCWVLL